MLTYVKKMGYFPVTKHIVFIEIFFIRLCLIYLGLNVFDLFRTDFWGYKNNRKLLECGKRILNWQKITIPNQKVRL